MKVTSQVNFAMIPEWVIYADITGNAVRLYAVLHRYANKDTRLAKPSRARIAEHMKVSTKTVDRAMDELEQIGAITIKARFTSRGDQTSNWYVVNAVPGGATQMSMGGDTGVATPLDTGVSQNYSHIEPESVNQRSSTPTSPASQDDAFAAFWETYPKRNGKRLYRGKAEQQWARLKPEQRDSALIGARHYRAACDQGMTIAKDAFRWLRDHAFDDWQEPARPESRKPRDRYAEQAERLLEREEVGANGRQTYGFADEARRGLPPGGEH